MIDAKKYIVDGIVEREKIAMDIKYRVISKQDIDYLVKNPTIKAAFFGQGYPDKKPQSNWNKEYVDRLSYAVVSEAFNEEYLLYLNEVADYVEEKEKSFFASVKELAMKHPFVSLIIVVAVIGLVGFSIYKMTR